MQSFRFLFFLLLGLISQKIYAQKNNLLDIPFESTYGNANDTSLPYWVRLMYAEHPNIGNVLMERELFYKNHPFEKNQHTQYFKRWIRIASIYQDEQGNFEAPDFTQWKKSIDVDQQNWNKNNTIEANSQWIGIGPFDFDKEANGRSHAPGSAHVYTVRQSTSNPNILYAGTASAGLWKSTDRGLSWKSLTNQLPTPTIRAIAIHPTNPDIMYFGGNSTIYKTTDGGQSFSVIGGTVFNTLSQTVYGLLIHPNNDLLIFAATNQGLYRSIDAGLTFTQIISASSNSSDYFGEIEAHPTDTNIIYAVLNAASNLYTKFYKSTDQGLTFNSKSGWPVNASSFTGTDNQKRAEITVTPAAPNRIYALLGGEYLGGTGLFGTYRSDDAGETWTHTCCGTGPGGIASISNPNILGYASDGKDNGGQYYYDLAIQADPANPNKVHAAGIMHWISLDAGSTWTNTASWSDPANSKYVHADIHDISISNNEVWIACDGGVFYSSDSGKVTFNKRQYGIQGPEFWGFGMGFKDGDIMIGGTYHNSHLLKNHNTYINGWVSYTGSADGMRGFVNPANPKIVYNDSGKDLLLDSRTATFTRMAFDKKPNANWYPGENCPLRWHPRSYNIIYSGVGAILWKTEDDGNSWTQIKDFGDGKITDIEISWSNPNVMYIVQYPTNFYADKIIWRSNDAGVNWLNVTPSNSITNSNNDLAMDLTISDSSENEIWLGFISPFNWTNADGYKIFYSNNGGTNWSNWTTSLLNGESIVNLEFYRGSPGGIYIGTRKGVYYRDKTMNNWVQHNNGLPLLTSSTKVLPYYKEGKLRNATNRGIFEGNAYQLFHPSAQASADKLISHCIRDTLYLFDYSAYYKTNATFTWAISPAPSYITNIHDENPKVVFSSPGTYSIELTVSDSLGTSTKTFNQFYTITNECGFDSVPGNALQITSDGQRAVTSSLKITTNSLTITCWVKPMGNQSSYAGLVFNYNSSVSTSVSGLNVRDNNELGYHWRGSNWSWSSGLYLTPGEWNHVAMVVTPTSVTIYKNGIGKTHATTISPSEFTELVLGSYSNWNSRTFKGYMDEVCIYNRSLSKNEIQNVMHLTKNNSNAPNLVAYYQFNETIGPILDRIGLNHANLMAGAARSTSTVPCSDGFYDRVLVSSSGTYTLPNTGVTLTFPSNGVYPNGDLVVSKLKGNPDFAPNSDLLGNYYIVVNNYGPNSTFSPLEQIKLKEIASISPSLINEPQKVRLYKRRSVDDLNTWNLLGQVDSLESGIKGNAQFGSSKNINSFSQFVVSFGTPTPLPIHWNYFRAIPIYPDFVQLDWSTISEFNSNYFIVERSSDNIHYDSIGQKKAKGFSNQMSNYTYIDSFPIHGVSYYRIKEIDFDGGINQSSVRSVIFRAPQNEINIFPNPIKTGESLQIEHVFNFINIQIIDANGKVIIQEQIGPGIQSILINTLSIGPYYLKTTTPNGVIKIHKFNKI